MNKPLLSIIIPAYNSEKYINKCLDSILDQTFKGFEIVIVNDGSKDNTVKKIESYEDTRIHIINQTNQGVGVARNSGIKQAQGEYILFVDSDDFLTHKNVLEQIANNIKEYDVIRFGFNKIKNDKLIADDLVYKLKNEYTDGQSFLEDAIDINKGYSWFLWQYAFKKELFDDVSFPAKKVFEDYSIIYKLLLKSQKVKIVKDNCYTYIYNETSLTRKVSYNLCVDYLNVIVNETNYVNNLNINQNLKKLLLNDFSYSYINLFNVFKTLKKDEQKLLKDKMLLNKNILDNCLYGKKTIIKILVKLLGFDTVSNLFKLRKNIKNAI